MVSQRGGLFAPSQYHQKLIGCPLKSTASEEITSSLVSVSESRIVSKSLPVLATFSIPIITSLDIITESLCYLSEVIIEGKVLLTPL